MSKRFLVISIALLVVVLGFWALRNGPLADIPAHTTAADAVNKATIERPHAVDTSLPFEDAPMSFAGQDEKAAFRHFKISAPSGERIDLIADYLHQWPDAGAKNDEAQMVSTLFDRNAAFVSDTTQELPKAGQWRSIKAMVGHFAQDVCADVTTVYVFRNDQIIATAEVHGVDYSTTHCPLTLDDYMLTQENATRETALKTYCTARAACLEAYFDIPENRALLAHPDLPALAAIRLQ